MAAPSPPSYGQPAPPGVPTRVLLIAPHGLSAEQRRAARAAIEAAGGRPSRVEAFDPPWAERWTVAGAGSSALRPALEEALWPLGAELVVDPPPADTIRLFLADMDSTMIGQECIDELAARAGRGPQVAAITERAMRGDIDFETALGERVAVLRGLETAVIDELLATRIRPSPGAATLIATLKAHGVRTVLVSGGFTAFTGPVAAMLGFDSHRANRLGVEGGRLAGLVEPPMLDAEAKAAILRDEARQLDLEAGQVMAAGDGANDALMLKEAGLGVAWRAKPAARAAARAAIAHADLASLLWACGIPRRRWLIR